jgi:hypothetical protein
MAYSNEDRQFSDRFLDTVKGIIGPRILQSTSFTLDTEEASDLTTLHDSRVRIAVRIRRPKYLQPQYRNHITLRATETGRLSELDKVISGYGDYLFYGFAASNDGTALARWIIVDLSRLRLYLHRCFREPGSESIRYGWRTTRDGSSFLWVDLALVHPESGIVLDYGRGQLSIYNASRSADQMFSGKDDNFHRLKRMVEPLEGGVVYEEAARHIANRLERTLPVALRDVVLYNVAYSDSGSPLVCAEAQSYYEFDEHSNEIPAAILAMESEARQKALRCLGIPTLKLERSMEVVPYPKGRYELWQYLVQDAAVNTSLKAGIKLDITATLSGYPVAGIFFRDKENNLHHFDIANLMFSSGNPFTFLVIDDEVVRKGRGFDAQWMRLLRATTDLDGTSTIAMAVCGFADGSEISGFARIPPLEPIFLRANAACLAEALACARLNTRCEEIRRADAAPDDRDFIALRSAEVLQAGSKVVTFTSTDAYQTYVNEALAGRG